MIRYLILTIAILLSISSYAQDGYKIKKVGFKGNDQIRNNELEKQTSTKSKTLINKVLFWKKAPVYKQGLVKKDLNNLYKLYQTKGYINVIIKDSLVVNDKKNSIRIYFIIKENLPITINSFKWIVIEKNNIEKKNILKGLPKIELVDKGNIFSDNNIYSLMKSAQNSLMNQGYVYASTKPVLKVDTINKKVDIKIKILQGDKYVNGKINIEGLKQVKRKLLIDKLKLSSGKTFSAKKLNEAKFRAFNSQLFKYLTINPVKDSTLNKTINYKVKLEELNQIDLDVSVGYGTEDRFRAQIILTKRAFLGGLRRLEFGVKTSYYEPINLYLKFRQPEIFNNNKNIDFIWNPYFNIEKERSYDVKRIGTNFTIEKKLSINASTFLAYNIESSKISKTQNNIINTKSEIIEGSKLKSGIILGYQYRKVDNYFNPTKGWYAKAITTYNGIGIKSKNSYFKIVLDGRSYRPFLNKCVFASRISLGYLRPINTNNSTPIEDRFLLGGSNSIRAYKRNSIGANIDQNSEIIGGNSMLEMNIETRFPIYKNFEGVVFIDAGNVWSKSEKYSISDLKYGAGLGIRYKTSIGPIRLDVATPLGDTYEMQLYITFGHAF